MNHDCHGDLFKLSDTEQYWRCLADGSCVPMALPIAARCPVCSRPIRRQDDGPVPTARRRVFTATQAWLPAWGWIDVKWEEIK